MKEKFTLEIEGNSSSYDTKSRFALILSASPEEFLELCQVVLKYVTDKKLITETSSEAEVPGEDE